MSEQELLEFIRRDGKVDAPILFLTIEDGGDFASAQEFRNYFESDGVWQPETREPTELGKPGTIIPKIILGIVNAHFKGWQSYRDNYLYLDNEWNLKFYPIARSRTSVWKDYYSEYAGLTSDEYRMKCLEVRPEIIWERYGQCITNSKLIIILGELLGWKKLIQIGKKQEIHKDVAEHDKNGRVKWSFHFSKGGDLEFVYFNMFRWGIRNAEILDFCRRLSNHISAALLEELRKNIENHESLRINFVKECG